MKADFNQIIPILAGAITFFGIFFGFYHVVYFLTSWIDERDLREIAMLLIWLVCLYKLVIYSIIASIFMVGLVGTFLEDRKTIKNRKK